MSSTAAQRRGGELAIVLHTHMPYVEGYGTWPFGEEWLWEAIATCYLPLLDVLARAPITLSLTPVLCDQLEAPGAMERCVTFLREVRKESHRRDIEAFRASAQPKLVAELERSAAQYAAAADRLEDLGDDLLAAFAPYVSWTSAATHAVLPLLATDAGAAMQVRTGIASHRRRFGNWHGGFWLPECAHAPWLDPLLEESGARATCVELTEMFGLGSPRHLHPLVSDDGPVLWPIDRQTMSLVWSEAGYPAAPDYRDYHGLTFHHHHAWCNEGTPYDHAVAMAMVREHAADFVRHVGERVRDGGVCVCPLDTELLGHWWYEGVDWLREVIEECARQGLGLTTLDDALATHEPEPAPEHLPTTSWGESGDLSTWSGPAVADLAWQARSAELRTIAAGTDAPVRAVRELLALQASDWAFQAARGGAGEYPRERAAGHLRALDQALAGAVSDGAVRNLAPDLCGRLY